MVKLSFRAYETTFCQKDNVLNESVKLVGENCQIKMS